MSKAFKGIIAGGMVGAIAWAAREYAKTRQGGQGQAVFMPVVSRAPEQDGLRDMVADNLLGLFGNALSGAYTDVRERAPDNLGGLLDGFVGRATGVIDQTTPRAPSMITGNNEPILMIVKRHESRGDYDAIWGGISRADYPSKPITQMTIGEVLAWQDSIDRKYNSEAVGAYQILEDTLRGLYGAAGLSQGDLFNRANQDRLGVALLERRGLSAYRSGQLSEIGFAQNLAKEWASFPAQTTDKRGRPATGQSYYAGDGLNKSLTSKAAVLTAVRSL